MINRTRGELAQVEMTLTEVLRALDEMGETSLAIRVDHARAEVAERVRGIPLRGS